MSTTAAEVLSVPLSQGPVGDLTILYGSQTGNAEYLAYQINEHATGRGLNTTFSTLDDGITGGIPAWGRLLVVTSTHDNGHMPDNAAAFWEWLQALSDQDLNGLPYAVLAIGDSMYDDFCKAGLDIDGRLSEVGAKRALDPIQCDIDFDFSAMAWAEKAITQLLEFEPMALAAPSSAAAEPFVRSATAPQLDVRITARVAEARQLSRAGSAKRVVHYDLTFDNNFEYSPGDSIEIYPLNTDRLVDEWLYVFGAAEQSIEVDGNIRTAREVLREDVELRVPHPGLLVSLSRLNPNPQPLEDAVDLIRSNDRDALDAWLWGRDVLDVISDLGCLSIPLEQILAELRPIQPRAYSIASSPLADAGHVHLCVSSVAYERDGRLHEGAGTAFLDECATTGTPVSMRRLAAHEFRLPEGDRAAIMIGPGVGVAPFRAFLRHRQFLGTEGKNWLFFGDQRKSVDWLYEDEMRTWAESGLLDKLNLAFSRDQTGKHYVQDEIMQHADEVRQWIDAGAFVFVCGDKNRMARDVDRTLALILGSSKPGSLSGEEALEKLKSEGRYVKDVY
jgi:sulfite reductase (NADPH) flavoprotein alpha-component